MKTFLLLSLTIIMVMSGCSKSGGSGSNNNTGTTNSTGLIPFTQGNQWSYRLKNYNTTTGSLVDSSDFTLTVNGSSSAGGVTYYKVLNSFDNSVLWLSDLTGTTLGSIDSTGGVAYYTAFVSGSGDSTTSASSWAVTVGTSCTGTAKLYGHFADTTLVNLDGTVYSNAIKNDVVIYNCSDEKTEADVYFIQQGVGLVRYVQYLYDGSGGLHMKQAWVLESSDLQ